MDQRPPSTEFDGVPLAEAIPRRRGPRMTPEFTHALREKLRSLEDTATRIPLPEGANPITMRSRIRRVAAQLGRPLTVRKIPGGMLVWRSSEEDLQQANEISQRLQAARRHGRARPARHKRA